MCPPLRWWACHWACRDAPLAKKNEAVRLWGMLRVYVKEVQRWSKCWTWCVFWLGSCHFNDCSFESRMFFFQFLKALELYLYDRRSLAKSHFILFDREIQLSLAQVHRYPPRNSTYQKWPYLSRSHLFQGPSFGVSILVFGGVVFLFRADSWIRKWVWSLVKSL